MKITAKTIKYAILPTLIVLLVGGIIDAYLCQYIIKDQSIILWLCIGSAFVFFIILWCCFVEYKNQVKWQKIDTIVNGIVQAIKCLIVPMLVVLAIAGGIDAYMYQCIIGKDKPISSVELASGCVALASLWLFFRRVKNQDTQLEQQNEQIDIQINKEIDDRFHAAVQLLASNETSARTGGIYSLYQLAVEPKGEKYRVQVAQILCSHIRSKTQEENYKETHKKRPSNEIQTAIDILFKDINGVKGIYQQDFSQSENFPPANLSYAYLQGANLEHAHCQRANFSHAQCQLAIFSEAQCQGAYFTYAQCQGASFSDAHCQGADFTDTDCEKAYFYDAQCQEAGFKRAQLQKTKFMKTQCQKADFSSTDCQETNFTEAQCQGADFSFAQCRETIFIKAHCQGAIFKNVQCQKINFYNAQCQGTYFINTQCQGADFIQAQCQGTCFINTQCQGANFKQAQCQGADFREAQCQGADFSRTQLQGAYAMGFEHIQLKERIGEDTELESLQFEGPLDDIAITSIENVKQYLPTEWYEKMKAIIKEHENKGKSYTNCIIADSLEDIEKIMKENKNIIPKGIITGILEDSHELQAIIKTLEAIEKWGK